MVVVGLGCVYWIACVPSGINKEINFVEICIGASDNHSRKTICGSVCESDRSRLLIRSAEWVLISTDSMEEIMTELCKCFPTVYRHTT